MSVVASAFQGHRVAVEVPRGGIDDWVTVAEVLLLEGLPVWVFPRDRWSDVPETVALFGRRARVGVSGPTDAAGVRDAVATGAHFVVSPVWHPDLAEAAGDVPFLGGALTPSEVTHALRGGADALAIAPADALGTAYARALPGMFPDTTLVPWGRLESYQVALWRDAGSPAAIVSDVVLRNETGTAGNTPDEVARRAGAFR